MHGNISSSLGLRVGLSEQIVVYNARETASSTPSVIFFIYLSIFILVRFSNTHPPHRTMASSQQQVAEIGTFTFKPSADGSPTTTAPPESFKQACTTLRSVPGVLAVYYGEQVEHAGRWNWVIFWESLSAVDDFRSSPGFAALTQGFAPDAASVAILQGPMPAEALIALDAPCTEVVAFADVDAGFSESSLTPFANLFSKDSLKGYHAHAFGEFEAKTHVGANPPNGATVVFLLGWDSMEAHFAERGEGKCKFWGP